MKPFEILPQSVEGNNKEKANINRHTNTTNK